MFPHGCRFVIPAEVKEKVQNDIRNIDSPDLPEQRMIEETLGDLKKKIPCPEVEPRTLLAAIINSGDPKKYYRVLETSLNMYALETLKI